MVPTNDEKVKFLVERGYTCEAYKHNCMCRHASFKPSAATYKLQEVKNEA